MATTTITHNEAHATTTLDLAHLAENVHGVGFYFPSIFTPSSDASFYSRLHAAHTFQDLTESNKPGVSFRKGVYLSRVQAEGPDALIFNLLRCSTNFQCPTQNFRDVDEEIIGVAQRAANAVFGANATAELNHVLAQVYHNTAAATITDESSMLTKEKKARIKSHSDKTKDMPLNGIMAFATFYSDDIAQKAKVTPAGDYVYKNGSVLTKLRWKLKASVTPEVRLRDMLKESFDVLLHPNSLLLMPLSTNRLYTREIVPPQLPVERLPTRLGYVIRCSNVKAMSRDGQTFADGRPLVEPTREMVVELKGVYREENISADVVEYGRVDFSMNKGDYVAPVL